MSTRSLRLRLFAGAALAIAAALVIAGLGLALLFERHVERRVDTELDNVLSQIAGNVIVGADGAIFLSRQPADPRFNAPLSGLYWEVRDATGEAALRSRSLWDETLDLPEDAIDSSGVHRHLIAGPGGGELIVRERQVTYPGEQGAQDLRIAAAVESADVRGATMAFARELALSLALLGLVLFAATWAQIQFGLKPLEAVRRAVGAVRSGREKRLPADFPGEVVPLVQEVNDLLDAQDMTIERARARAADLAHGLKTPLTVLSSHAERVRDSGDTVAADELSDIVDSMRRHVERAIAVARLTNRPSAPIEIAPVVRRVTDTLARTPAGEHLKWDIAVPVGLYVAMDAEDLYEALGNLAENAVKWTASKVVIHADAEPAYTVISVEDDGPGIPAESREKARKRWERLDTARPGSGLGLAIVAEIAQSYGGELRLGEAATGGLRATLALPIVSPNR